MPSLPSEGRNKCPGVRVCPFQGIKAVKVLPERAAGKPVNMMSYTYHSHGSVTLHSKRNSSIDFQFIKKVDYPGGPNLTARVL